MTEAIKQWIADQALKIAEQPAFTPGTTRIDEKRQTGAIAGLSKGIEISVGFAEWVEDLYMQEKKGRWYTFDDHPKRDYEDIKFFTTSQLLEKYLEHLSSINKEK